MKPFSFRLNRVLNYRKHLEKRAKRDLLNARNAYKWIEKEIHKLVNTRDETARACREEGMKGINVNAYHIYTSFLQKLSDDLDRARESLEDAKEKVKVQEAILKEASINRKSLEILKDLKFRRYIENSEREEQRLLDELIIIRKGGMA